MSNKLSAKEKYPFCYVTFRLDDDPYFDKTWKGDYKEVKSRIESMGGKMYIEKNLLTIIFDSDPFIREKTRNAGRKHKYLVLKEGNFAFLMYSDIVYMRYGKKMTWDKIAEKIDMSRASFYRKKKKIVDSPRYKRYLETIDLNRADDLSYLKSFKDEDYII